MTTVTTADWLGNPRKTRVLPGGSVPSSQILTPGLHLAVLATFFLVPAALAEISFGPGNSDRGSLADVAFVALQQEPGNGNQWDIGLFDPAEGWKPVATGDSNRTSGSELFWSIAYDGTGTLTYSWGVKPDDLTGSITYDLGPVDFTYLSISAGSNTNRHGHTPTVANLRLQTELGVFQANPLGGSTDDAHALTFTYDTLNTFGSFTLTGSTQFDDGYSRQFNGGQDFVTIYGGGSAVVGEPASIAIFLIGLTIYSVRAMRRRHAAPSTPGPAQRPAAGKNRPAPAPCV